MRLDSAKVRWHRDRLGWTLDELANKAGVAKGTLLRAEHGEDIQPRSGRRIAQAFDVDISELVPEMPGVATRPKVLRPRTLEEFLERAGLETRWFTLPDEEFDLWWLGVDWEEAKRRFWQINAEYQIIAAETAAALRREGVTVDPQLARQLGESANKTFARHFGALAAAPGREETKEEFYERQKRQELRQFKRIDLEKAPEEVVARAS
jgi:transcriptional regulator with XRE-family HTH domain